MSAGGVGWGGGWGVPAFAADRKVADLGAAGPHLLQEEEAASAAVP